MEFTEEFADKLNKRLFERKAHDFYFGIRYYLPLLS